MRMNVSLYSIDDRVVQPIAHVGEYADAFWKSLSEFKNVSDFEFQATPNVSLIFAQTAAGKSTMAGDPKVQTSQREQTDDWQRRAQTGAKCFPDPMRSP